MEELLGFQETASPEIAGSVIIAVKTGISQTIQESVCLRKNFNQEDPPEGELVKAQITKGFSAVYSVSLVETRCHSYGR